jgi:hypothetical protein
VTLAADTYTTETLTYSNVGLVPGDYSYQAQFSSSGETVTSFTNGTLTVTSSEDSPEDDTSTVPQDGEITKTFSPEDTANTLVISGEVDGWTVTSTTPDGVSVNPEPGTTLSQDSQISTFGSYQNGEFAVTLSPPSDASRMDRFQFNVTELNGDTVISETSFTIIIGSTPSWVDGSSITPTQYNAVDDGDGELTDAEVRSGIQTYVQNSLTGDGQIDGVEFSDGDIRALISGYIQSQF